MRSFFLYLPLCVLSLSAGAQTGPAALTSFTGLSNNNYYLQNATSGSTASNIGSTGWDISAYFSSGTVTVRSIALSSPVTSYGALGAGDPFIRTERGASPPSVSYTETRVKANNNTAFALLSIALNTVSSAPASAGTYTITGYKGGLAVTGAVFTQSMATANGSWSTLNVGTNTAFRNIDEFRITATTGIPSVLGSLNLDEISVRVISALPLDLLSFKAAAEGPGNRITWETAGRTTGIRYRLERSADGGRYETINETLCNVATAASHAFYDDRAAGKTWYYRLNMQEPDGTQHYSATAIVRHAGATGINIRVFPQPARNTMTVTADGFEKPGAIVVITDVKGQERYRFSLQPSQAIDVHAWAPGVYLLHLPDAGVVKLLKD